MDEGLYSEAKDDGQVFKQDSVRHLDLSLMYPPDEMKAYTDMQSPGEKGRPYVDMERNEKMETDGRRSGRENSHKEDLIQPDERGGSEELENPQLLKAGTKNGLGDEATKHLEEESSDDDCSYEEIEEQHESSQRKNESKENAVNEEKANVERHLKNPRSKTTQVSFDKRPSRAAIATCPMNQSDIIISGHRDEDWMDFTDIEHHLKLRKQLREALAEKAELEKRVSVTGQSLTAESQTQQPPTSDYIENAPPHMDKADSLDKNHNRLNSSEESCTHSQRGTQAETRSESVPLNSEGNYHETEMQKNSSLLSPAPKKVVPGNVSYHQNCSLTNAKELDDSDDNDDYEECHDRVYVNQQTGVNYSFENVTSEKEFHDHYVNVERQQLETGNDMEDAEDGINSIYYNTVDLELETRKDGTLTSTYLQLDNPNDEEENVYANVDPHESEKGPAMIKAEGNQAATFKAITAEIETFNMKKAVREGAPNAVGCIEEPPPLPPKKRASSLRDAE